MVKILISALLALMATSTMAVIVSNNGDVLLTNHKPSRSSEPTKKLKTTYYESGSLVTKDAIYANNLYATPENPNTLTINNKQPSFTFEVPYGYRLPTKADVFGDWEQFNAPNHLVADFNGDGMQDEAYILPKKGSKLGYAVFVSIDKTNSSIQNGREFQMFKLTSRDDMKPQSFAIELAEPSNKIWATACGKGYWECEIGEPAEVKIANPSIMFCYIESSCTMYMWDSDKKFFKEIHFSG